MQENVRHTNALIHEKSPYLLQHAHNPVNWLPWRDEFLRSARDSGKPWLVSIGYSACHWCHVMEREVFENEAIAAFMNENFICFKVDREERPDVDMVYMKALLMMNGQGGWPLNCFALPDGKPFFGGTYFPPVRWMQVLQHISGVYSSRRPELEALADRITLDLKAKQETGLLPNSEDPEFSLEVIENAVQKMRVNWDFEFGGNDYAPKFPMPDLYLFLLRYGFKISSEPIKEFTFTTISKMVNGGIHDHLQGGFARYSTDHRWHVPHFEKMLYDNAQMLGLLAEASHAYKNDDLSRASRRIFDFLNAEMRHSNGLYYSALDADSEGIEGAFYVWTYGAFEEVCKEQTSLFASYYQVSPEGNWENGQNVLFPSCSIGEFCKQKGLPYLDFLENLDQVNQKLFNARKKRSPVGLDDKCLLSWNALMVSNLCRAGFYLDSPEMLQEAKILFSAIQDNFKNPTGGFFHKWHKGKAEIPAFLDDYVFFMRAGLDLFYATGEEGIFMELFSLLEYVERKFGNPNNDLLYFNNEGSGVPVRMVDFEDNVVPSSNAVLAGVYQEVGLAAGKSEFTEKARKMLRSAKKYLVANPFYSSHWMQVWYSEAHDRLQFFFLGKQTSVLLSEFSRLYYPFHVRFCAPSGNSNIPIFDGKKEGAYVCSGNTCLPGFLWS